MSNDYEEAKKRMREDYDEWTKDVQGRAQSVETSEYLRDAEEEFNQHEKNGLYTKIEKKQSVKTGMEGRDLFDLVGELQKKGYSKKDIAQAMDVYLEVLTAKNNKETDKLKTTEQKTIYSSISEKAEKIIMYGKDVANQDWTQDVINVAQRIVSELKMDNSVNTKKEQKSTVQLQQVESAYGVYGIQYGIENGKIVRTNCNMAGPISSLFPPEYIMPNGETRIGKARRLDPSVCRNIAELELRKVIINKVISMDIQAKAKKSGKELTDVEKDFIKRNEQDMKDWGVLVQKDGTIYQKEGIGYGLTVKGDYIKITNQNVIAGRSR